MKNFVVIVVFLVLAVHFLTGCTATFNCTNCDLFSNTCVQICTSGPDEEFQTSLKQCAIWIELCYERC
ncbi:unnamed protein product [Callosobruchus maculatus]|uniref:Uncharacterized protein n=1 Tax=Callosobruchus maculatus TaxID=64391 RepID=A0A653DJM5_CALMS|nr:unnamed protein product [Callosobruchus maculatus]